MVQRKLYRNHNIKSIGKRKWSIANVLLFLFSMIGPVTITASMIYILIFNKPGLSFENQMESSGISIIGIAVSVWIGLNIYNTLSKNDIEEAIAKLGRADDYLNKQLFLNEVEKSIEKYELSRYFYEEFQTFDVEMGDIDFIKMKEIENLFFHCCNAYENNKWKYSRDIAETLRNIISRLIKQDKKLIRRNLVVEIYLKARLGDSLFYRNIALQRENGNKIDINELSKSIGYYEDVLNHMDKDSLDKECVAYIYNTLGYTRYYLSKFDGKNSCNFRIEALRNMDCAIDNNSEKGRYYRNRGLIYDYYFCNEIDRNSEQPNLTQMQAYDEAKKNYLRAITYDKTDYKAYNNLAALYLRKLDIDNGINSRAITLDKIQFKGEVVELKRNLSYLEIASMLSPNFEDALYNQGKVYMYLYLVGGRRDWLPDCLAPGLRQYRRCPWGSSALYPDR